jgi:8-oxo-dGTP pyrophosphatase MutT (NUDIX family)
MTERHLTRTAVYVALEQEKGEVFFLRRANTGWADGMLTVPAGHVDKGDTVLQAAIKEVREEAGVAVKEEDLEFVHVAYMRDEYVIFCFRAKTWEGTPHIGEPHLSSEAIWIPKNNLPQDVVPQLRNLFVHIQQNVFFSELEREV